MRPFVGATLAALALAIERQELQLPKRMSVPERVRRVLERGLAAEPAARHADMPALLAQLRSAAAPRTRRWVAAAGAAVVVPAVTAAVVLASGADNDTARCQVPTDALAGVWDAPVRDQLRAAFAAAKQGHQLFPRVAATLDGYQQAWVAMRRASCEATRVRGEQSETLLDLRIACLDRKRAELHALTRGLAEADGTIVMGSVRAALGLSPVTECADGAALAAPLRLPDGPLRGRVDAERAALAEVKALRLLGELKPALEKARTITARASELKYRPLEAEALLVQGDLEDRASGDTATAIKLLEQAVVAADAGNHRRVAAEAWSALAWLEGYVEHKFDRAELAVKMAGAAIESLHDNDELAAQLINYEALILDTKGQLAPARAKYQEALAARDRVSHGDTWQLAMVLNDLAAVERQLGDFAASRTHHERALAIRRKVFGDKHPYVFTSILNLGNLAWSQHDYKRAEEHYRAALAMAPDIFPPQHPQTALALANLASALENQTRYPEAIEVARRALAMYEAVRGPEHPAVADTLHNLGNLLGRTDHVQEGREAYERALAILDKDRGGDDADDDPALASLLSDYGELLLQLSERHKARAALERSVALVTKRNADDPDLAFPLTALGELDMAEGRTRDAMKHLERALALRTEHSADEARTQLALAKLVWRSDRARSRAFAQAAEQHATGKLREQVVQWRATHR